MEIVDGIPAIVETPKTAAKAHKSAPVVSNIDFARVKSCFGAALHMHQPTIPAGGGDIHTAQLIGNLQHMMDNQHIGDNHNASVFLQCYARMVDFIHELVDAGKNPRIMLDYSGNLLWGLRQMGQGWVLDNWNAMINDKKYFPHVEWLGTMWSHAVASSTPVPDLKLHIMAWRSHFAAIFGEKALERVKGFSPPEMHLPIHPDVCYEYITALNECGYEWLMVQEHTIETIAGNGNFNRYFPHKLVAKNSEGKVAEISVLIKTQGSDTKLVAQMQPFYEAISKGREKFCGKDLPPFVLQIADGENGGVMMNEFPPCYKKAMYEMSNEGTVAMNGTEYLDFIQKQGIKPVDFPAVQPITQHRIWAEITEFKSGAANAAITRIKAKDQGYNLDKGSWTSDKNWVNGYSGVLDPMNKLSAAFHKKYDGKQVDVADKKYREALMYLLLSETSCFRYWGEGIWTEYAKELCRRGLALV